MYDYFTGKLVEKGALYVVLEVQGIGYKLHIPLNLVGKLPGVGQPLFLYVSWVVREMSQTLYGFDTKSKRDLFELLLTLSGIGPKTALAIVGYFDPSHLEEAVRIGNSAALVQVPGVGKKTAERLIVDLRDKLKFASLPTTPLSSKVQDALNALLHLGYSQPQAEHALKKAIDEVSEESDLSLLISTALKSGRKLNRL
jgi:holliday junction DNA helicase RuvA